jgi:type IV secretion system protein VirB4
VDDFVKLEWMIFGGGAVLAVLVVMLVSRLPGRDDVFRVQSWRRRGKRKADMGFCDLLLYDSLVEDGVIIGKNGALMAAWRYEGPDAESSTDEQRDALVQWGNDALRLLGNGYMLHVDCAREHRESYSDPLHSHFPDAVSAAIDEERRRYFGARGTYYESEFYIVLTYFPPVVLQKKFVDLMIDDDERKKDAATHSREIVAGFNQAVLNFETMLSNAFKLRRLKSRVEIGEDGKPVVYDDFLSWLHYCITGDRQPIRLPMTAGLGIDSLVGGVEYHRGLICKVGDKFMMAVDVGGLPQETYAGILNALVEMPLEYRWSTRFIYMDEHEAVKSLEKLRSKWRQKVRGFIAQIFGLETAQVNLDAVAMVDECQEFIADANSGLVASGILTSVVILMHEERKTVEDCAGFIRRSVAQIGFTTRVETINTTQAFLGSLPGDGIRNVRRNMVHSLHLSSLIPQSTIWTGEDRAPCPLYPPLSPPLMHCVTSTNTPFRLNLHVRDLGHSLVFGPTGSGKSVLLAALAAQFRRYEDMSIYCFDKGMSMYTLCKAMGGQHFNVAADEGALAFCPLQYLDTQSDIAWAAQWVEVLMTLNNVEVTPGDRNEITRTLVQISGMKGRSLTNFCTQTQSETIRTALHDYTVQGSLGYLLDAKEDNLSLSRFTVFEIEELMQGAGGQGGNRIALPVLLYLFRRIERSLCGQPACIILDEAWLMLGHPAFRGKIVEWLKVLRKANCCVVLATQSLSDAAQSGILDVLVESTATKIFLPNIYARDEMASQLYQRMGLNQRQIEIIASARPKRHYYYVSERGRRLFELALGPFAISFVGVSDKDTVAEIRKMEEEHGAGWVDAWLDSRGVAWPGERSELRWSAV